MRKDLITTIAIILETLILAAIIILFPISIYLLFRQALSIGPFIVLLIAGIYIVCFLVRDIRTIRTNFIKKRPEEMNVNKMMQVTGDDRKVIIKEVNKEIVSRQMFAEGREIILIMRQSQFPVVIGLMSATFLSTLLLIAIFTQYSFSDIWIYLMGVAMIIPMLFLAYYYLFWKIVVKNNELIIYPIIQPLRKISLNRVTKIVQVCGSERSISFVELYFGMEKMVTIKASYKNYNLMIDFLKQRFEEEEFLHYPHFDVMNK